MCSSKYKLLKITEVRKFEAVALDSAEVYKLLFHELVFTRPQDKALCFGFGFLLVDLLK